MEARFRLDGPAAAVSEFRRWRPLRFARRATAVFASRVAAEFTPAELRDTLTTCGVPLADQAPFLAYAASGSAPDPAWVNEISGALVAKPPGQPQPWHAGMLNAAIRYGDRQVTAVLARHWAREVPAGQWTFSTANSEGTAVVRCHAAAAVFAEADLTAEELVPAQLRPQKAGQGGEPDPREHDRKQWTEIVEPIAAAAVLAVRAATGAAGAADVGTFIDQGLAVRAERAGYRWFTHDPSYRAWAVLAAEAAADAGSPPPVLARLADAAQRLLGYGAPELWLDLAVMLSGRGSHTAIAADLCSRAADGARTGTYPAPDRLDIIARAADTAAAIEPDLGRELFGQAVDVAAGINDDAARLLAVHADLASHASLPVHDRPRVAVRLVRAVEAVAPHVTDPRIIPYTEIAGAAARLHPAAGLAAATRWDDQDRIAMASTLPAALAAAVDAGEVTTWQALALDHLIDDDRDRLGYQLDIADRMRAGGAAGQAAARVALGRAAQRLRLDVAACDQPQLARTLLDAAGKHGLDGQIRAVLDPVCALGAAPGTTRGLPSTRRDGGELQPEMQAMLADPATRGWDRLADDVAALTGASVYGEELRTFIASVVGSAPLGERVDALAAAAALPGEHATTVLSVLADYLRQWRTWPGVTAWAAAELPDLLHRCLPDLAWNQDTGRLLSQLRAFADNRTVRQAILRALPEARPRLTAFGWQNICALLGRLCDSGEAATALLALLDDRLQGDDSEEAAAAGPEGPVPMVLWSAFGHPRRAIRWRAAHAARDLLAHPDPAAAGPLAAALVRCLDHDDPGPFRDPALHFYRLSASTGLLVALQQIAVTDPALLVPHLDELIRHATSRDLPHAQIRELARQAVLAIAAPADPRTETLRSANQPDRCHTYRKPRQAHSDRRISEDRRYRFDQMDTIPYWYAPLARVFDIPVDTVAEFAEGWIIDRWGLSDDVWWTDARELRDQQSWKRTSHRQGSIPPEESLQLYLEYHAMMTAAGQLTDAGRPVQISSWDPSDEWQYWLSAHLPARPWLADLRAPVPADPALFDQSPVPTGTWDLPGPDWYDQALGLKDGQLASDVLVAANTTVHRRVGWEQAYISSAIVRPDHASDLQRALAATPDPTDWKLPDEDESDFEVAHGAFELRGWLTDLPDHRGTLDEHDPYAYGLRRGQPMPGRAFRDRLNAAPGADGFTLVAPDGTILARAEQWADPSTMDDRDTAARSSGSRTRVARDALLRFLTITGSCLIVEVQLGRHRSGTDSGEYQPPRSRIYLIDASGHVTAT